MIEGIKLGLELYAKNEDKERIKNALKENLYREIRYNAAIFDEINKESEDIGKLVSLLKTDFYDYIKNALVILDDVIGDIEVNFDDEKITNKNYTKWTKDIKNETALIERAYLRITVLKSLATVGITKRKNSYQYAKYLLLALKKNIELDLRTGKV